MKKIVFVFVINLIFLIILGFVSMGKLTELSQLNEKLYLHPFAVTNATKTIDANIISMHRYMKDIAYSSNMKDIEKAKKYIDAGQIIVYEQFDTIFQRYLGDREDIQKSYDLFVAWGPIRNEVIALEQEGKKEEAFSITKGKGAQHVEKLNLQISYMISYAHAKAESFRKKSIKIEADAMLTIRVLLGFILLISISIFIVVARSISRKDKKIQEYFYLIDQNIMNVILDSKCKIIGASSAMSKYMNLTKEKLLATPNYFLLSDCTHEERENIAKIMQYGKPWTGEIKKIVDGEERWLHSSLHPAVDDKNEYTNILNDITMRKKIEEVSRLDALTSLYNRGYFDKIFPEMIKIAKRNETLLAFVMLDIDYFKQYNDIYGHQAGDEALKKVSDTLNIHLNRPDDYAFRIGGEEFAMLFYVKKEEESIGIGKDLIEKVENLEIEHNGSEVSNYLTISMGIYTICVDETLSVDEIYKRADDLLYKAKHSGRNNLQV